MSSPEINSSRFSLRPVTNEDLEALHALFADEEVRRYLWGGKEVSLETTGQIVEKSQRLFDEFGFGVWLVREGGIDSPIGFAGYWHFYRQPVLELFYGVAPRCWRRGIATECGSVLIRYAFQALRFRRVEASVHVDNTASARVLEKLRMVWQRREVVDGRDAVFYALERDDWERANSEEPN